MGGESPRESTFGDHEEQVRALHKLYADHVRTRTNKAAARGGARQAEFVAWCFQTLLGQGWEPERARIDEQVRTYLLRLFPPGSSTLPVEAAGYLDDFFLFFPASLFSCLFDVYIF